VDGGVPVHPRGCAPSEKNNLLARIDKGGILRTMVLEEKKIESLPQEEKEKYKQIYEIARDSFLEQLNRIESLDKKAQINLAVIGIVLGLGLFKTELLSNSISQITLKDFVVFSQFLCLVISFLLFMVSLVFSILSLRPRDFQIYPDVADMSKKFEDKNIEDLHASMSAFFEKVILQNENGLKSKTNQLNNSLVFILIAFPFAVAFIVLTVIAKMLNH
jgi:hypothetical protein